MRRGVADDTVEHAGDDSGYAQERIDKMLASPYSREKIDVTAAT